MQVVYWTRTHPTNRIWLQTMASNIGKVGGNFFSLEPSHDVSNGTDSDWQRLRDRWEYSHIARAGLALVSFVALVIAVAVL
jgi:hypothetical protein